MIDLSQIREDILTDCLIDWENLSSIPFAIREDLGVSSKPAVRRLTMELLRELLERGLVVIGDLDLSGDRGFEPWNLGPEASLKRIEREWTELGREPEALEIGWMSLTELGREEARKLDSAPKGF